MASQGTRLPPGQVETRKFPVVGEKTPAPAATDLASWRLVVDGLVEARLELAFEDVMALPQGDFVADIHCVTGWSHLGMRLGGVRLSALLDRARPRPEARFVRFVAYSGRDHDTTLPLERAAAETWLVHSRDGAPLTVEHGYPLRTVTPSRYFYKSLKWVHRIELRADDPEGYWERESAYHNNADPWAGDQRFKTGSIDPKRLEQFRAATSLDRYRGPQKLILSADLRGWSPTDRDLHALHLKHCDLRGTQLAGVDLRGANLSLCDLRGADLRGADLREADLEGVNFAGADLRDAKLDGAALSAARFVETGDGGDVVAALVTGMTRAGATGLLESEDAFLRAEETS